MHGISVQVTGICMHTRINAKLFKLARLKTKINPKKEIVQEILLADDTALVANYHIHIQRLVNGISEEAEKSAFRLLKTKQRYCTRFFQKSFTH